MALFDDGMLATIEDLKTYESGVLQTASIEGIDVAAKLLLAQREMGFEIAAFLSRHGFCNQEDLRRVVISESLLHWHAIQALELIYRDAYNTQLNDRYLGKWKEYSQAVGRAAATAYRNGIGMVAEPIARAISPNVTYQPGGLFPERTYFVAVNWHRTSGTAGEKSSWSLVTVPGAHLLRVSLPSMPTPIHGWSVTVGSSQTEAYRQNEMILASSQTWLEDVSGLRTDLSTHAAQTAEWYVRHRHLLQRG